MAQTLSIFINILSQKASTKQLKKIKAFKKIALVAAAAVLSISFASAQIGIQAGYTSNTNSVANESAMSGFHVGPTYNMNIQGPISLQYGLLYNYLTRSTNFTNSTQHALDIPVRVAATFPLSGNVSIFGFAGPNFGIGLVDQVKISNVITDYYDTDSRSRFNLQLGAGAGLQFNRFGAKFSYDFGMLDLDKTGLYDRKVNSMKVGLFYNF